MRITMPTEEEKKRSVQLILEQGLPQKKPLQVTLPVLVRTIGLRNLFWNTGSCMFLALLGGILLILFFTIPAVFQMQLLPLSLMLSSPAVYGLLLFLTAWQDRQLGLYAIKMTCYYTLKELTALRMVFFGGACAILDVFFVLCLWHRADAALSLFQMMGVSLSALFLYGTATLLVLSRGKNRQWLVPLLWCAACLFPVLLGIDILELLRKFPGAAALIAALLVMVLFVIEVERYLSATHKGGIYHVIS